MRYKYPFKEIKADPNVVYEVPEKIWALIGLNLWAEVLVEDMQGLYEQIIAENANMTSEA